MSAQLYQTQSKNVVHWNSDPTKSCINSLAKMKSNDLAFRIHRAEISGYPLWRCLISKNVFHIHYFILNH